MLQPSEISQSVLSVGIDARGLEFLAAKGTKATYSVGDTILAPEEMDRSLLLLLVGECEVLGVMADELNHLGPGSLLGEVAFIDRGARSARVVAKTPCVVAVFPEDLAETLRKENPALAAQFTLNLAKVLCKKLRQASRLIEAIQV